MSRLLIAFGIFILILTSLSGNLFAITDEEVFRNFQFSFLNPGARSTAMGGAFIGLADDATAAEANPAGLTILTKPEVSFEYRGTRYDADKLNSFNGDTAQGIDFSILSANILEDLNQPSFLSIVFPAAGSTYGISRQESVRQKGDINELFFLSTSDVSGSLLSLATVDQKIVNWNFSYGTKLSDNLSIGASVRYAQLDWKNEVQNSVRTELGSLPQFNTTIDGTDKSFGFNVGLLGRLGGHASWGVVYKRNPKFQVQETATVFPLAGFMPPERSFTNVLKIPDTFGTGIAIKPNDNFTVLADIVYIKYSDLTQGFKSRFNILTSVAAPGLDFKVDNKIEFHVGTEFVVLLKNTPMALREGFYRKPSNSLLVKNSLAIDSPLLNAIFTKRENENHFTLGTGFVFGPNFQVDWAADLAKSVDTFTLSTVVRF